MASAWGAGHASPAGILYWKAYREISMLSKVRAWSRNPKFGYIRTVNSFCGRGQTRGRNLLT